MPTAELLLGLDPDRMGELATRVERVREQARRHGRLAEIIWLVPTERLRTERLRRLLLVPAKTRTDRSAALLAPGIQTFDSFAEAILKRYAALGLVSDDSANTIDSPSGTDLAIGSGLQRRLLRLILDRLHREHALEHFASLAETAGLLDLISGLISELKRDEIWPDDFLGAWQQIGRRIQPRDRELHRIYAEYQAELLSRRWYDPEGRFWLARTALLSAREQLIPQLDLLIADGFTDFTRPQLEMIDCLARVAQHSLASVATEAQLTREELFQKPQQTVERLSLIFEGAGRTIREVIRAESPPQAGPWGALQRQLFRNPREILPLPQPPEIEVVAATGPHAEFAAIGRRVRGWLNAGVPAHEIAIVSRDLRGSGYRLAEFLIEMGVPVWCDVRWRLTDVPILRALFGLLAIESEDWSFQTLLAAGRSLYFAPPAWGASTRARWDAINHWLRSRKLHRDRLIILDAAQHALSQAAAAASHDREKSAALPKSAVANDESIAGVASQSLLEFDRWLAPFRTRHSFTRWLELVLGLAETCGLTAIARAGMQSAGPETAEPPTAHPDAELEALDRRDLEAWGRMEELVEQLAGVIDPEAPSLTLAEFLPRFRELLSVQTLPPAPREERHVRILDATAARHLDLPRLLLVGLNEGSFPNLRGDDCLYRETDRLRLNSEGLTLTDAATHQAEERRLFFALVTRPRTQLVLTYSEATAKGQPLFPSPYLQELTSLFSPETFSPTREGSLDPVPSAAEAVAMADWRLVAVHAARRGEPGPWRFLADQPRFACLTTNVLWAAELSAARFHQSGWTIYEGFLNSPELQAGLATRFGARHQFSVTQLEAYAGCPFRFWLSQVLEIAPLESVFTGTDHRERGIAMHAAVAQLLSQALAGDVTRASEPENAAVFQERLEQLINRRTNRTELQRSLAKVELDILSEWAERFPAQSAEYLNWLRTTVPADWTTQSTEIVFGRAGSHDDELDPEITLPPLQFGPVGNRVSLSGRIDRVDYSRTDPPQFTVIDYKTGLVPRFSLDQVRHGQSLQLAVYLLAVIRLKLLGPSAEPVQIGYWSFRDEGFEAGLKSKTRSLTRLPANIVQTLATVIDELIPRLAAGIRGGQFVVDSLDPDCTGRCPYHMTCRVNQVRSLAERLQKDRNHLPQWIHVAESPRPNAEGDP